MGSSGLVSCDHILLNKLLAVKIETFPRIARNMSSTSNPKTATLAIDQGTHASRALLFDGDGRVLSTHRRKIALIRDDPYRAEQDPEEIISSVRYVIRKAQGYANTHQLNIRRAGISVQRSTTVAWDKTSGKALYPAMSWQDTRASSYLAGLQKNSDVIKTLTGLQISAHYGASKLRWLLENVPEVIAAARSNRLCLGPLSSFILHRLIEKHPLIVDHGNASRTLLWNLHACQWDPRLLKIFRISSKWLPSPRPIRCDYGRLEGSNIRVSAVNGDQPSALFGQGSLPSDGAAINIGSGAFIMCDTGNRPIAHPRLLTAISDSDRRSCRFCLEGTVNGAGTALQWAEKNWDLDLKNIPLKQRAQEPPLFINTVGGLGSPWWYTGLSTQLLGLAPADCRHKSMLCLVAILESIVFMLYANVKEMIGAGITIRSLSVAGGLSRYRYLCQALADLSGLNVTRCRETEITARGIAWLTSDSLQPFPSLEGELFTSQANADLKRRYRHYMTLISEAIDSERV